VYLVPALKLGRHEAFQVAYFLERGLKVGIGGSMMSMGANAPVTYAGAVTLNLAEQLALRILEWAFFGEHNFSIFSSIAALDMRTTIRPFGRPEMAVTNLMSAQVARALNAAFSGHAGLTDAKLPSVEVGYQKALSAIPTLLAGGSLWMDTGLLAIDEVCSPIQMVLDNEFLSALKLFTHSQPVDEEAIGLEMILAAGPGGSYVAEEHTARHFRRSLWQPGLWSREMLAVWEANGARLDVDKAAEIALRVPAPTSLINEEFEQAILNLIQKAAKELS
jgi:trimethylamine--corrinoid protein Co-methyltransferase